MSISIGATSLRAILLRQEHQVRTTALKTEILFSSTAAQRHDAIDPVAACQEGVSERCNREARRQRNRQYTSRGLSVSVPIELANRRTTKQDHRHELDAASMLVAFASVLTVPKR